MEPNANAGDSLTIKLPQAITVTEVTVTRDGLGRLLDAAAGVYLKNLPTDGGAVTLHLAMKQAARLLLWYAGKNPMPGWSAPPRLTRHDDATAVVIKYMLTNFFGEALRRSGGTIDAQAGADALTSASATQAEGEYGELVAAVAGLVSGPDATPSGGSVPPVSRPAQSSGESSPTREGSDAAGTAA